MNTQLQNNRPVNQVTSFNAFMQKHKTQLELALPKHLNADRMVRLALTAFSQSQALQSCDQKSIFASIIIASQLGLEPGVNGQGYLVPYKGTCTFIPGWKGLVDLANRGGRCTVWTGAVYEGDEFDYMLGDAPYCKHKPNGEFDESKLTHVYAIGRVKDSEMPVIEVWPIRKVHAHFKKNVIPKLQPNHYSKKHFEAYARKVALLQVLKYMPQSIELSNAMDVSYGSEQGKGITIDGDFVSVSEDLAVENNQDAQSEDVVDATFDETDVTPALTFAQIKRGILSAKSITHLAVIEEQALEHADISERKQLIALVKAQTQKISEPQDSKPVVNSKAITKNTVDPIKSDMAAGGILLAIKHAKNIKELKSVSKTIDDTKDRLLPEHLQKVTHEYDLRQEYLDQGDIFDAADGTDYVEAVITRIQAANSQDDINSEFMDPAYDELDSEDRMRIDVAAQKRSKEIQG